MTRRKWKKFENDESYALVIWKFRQEPDSCMVLETARSLGGILAKIPEASVSEEEEEEFDIVHVKQWITDGDEALPHPHHITVLYSITIRNVEDEEEEEESAA